MPSRNRPTSQRRPEQSSSERTSQEPSVEPVAELATQPITPAHIQPVAETMGNDAAQAAVDDWVRSNHGGPENPDDPDDLWYWKHKGTVNWDFTPRGELERKGSKTTETADGGVTGTHRMFADASRAIDKTTGTVTTKGSGAGSVGYERSRESEAESATDRFDVGGDSSYKRVTTKDGKVSQTFGGQIEGAARFDTTRRDGSDTRHDVVDHRVTLGGQGTRDDGKFTAADLHSDIASSWEGAGSYGPENDRRERVSTLSGALKTSRKGVGEDAIATGNLVLGGSNEIERTTTGEGSSRVAKTVISGDLDATRQRQGSKVEHSGDAAFALSHGVDSTVTDGKVETKRSGAGSIATEAAWAPGERSGKVAGDLSGSRTITETLDDGSLSRHLGAAVSGELSGSKSADGLALDGQGSVTVDGSRARVVAMPDGSIRRVTAGKASLSREVNKAADGTTSTKTSGELSGSLDRERTTKLDDGSLTLGGKGGLSLRGSSAVDGASVRTNSGGLTLSGEGRRERVTELADGGTHTLTTKGGAKVIGDLAKTEGKHVISGGADLSGSVASTTRTDSGSVTRQGGAEVAVRGKQGDLARSISGTVYGAHDATTELSDTLSRTDHVGAALSGGVARDSQGVVTRNAGVTIDGSRATTETTDTGSIERKVAGLVGGGRKVVVGKDGERVVTHDAKVGGDWSRDTRTQLDDGSHRRVLEAGGRLSGETSSTGDRSGTASITGSVRDERVTELADGASKTRTLTGGGELGGSLARIDGKVDPKATAALNAGYENVHKRTVDGAELSTTDTLGGKASGSVGKGGTGSGRLDLSGGRSHTRRETVGERTIDTTTAGKASVGGGLARTEEGWKNDQNAKIEASRDRVTTWTDEAGVDHKTTSGLSGNVGGTRSSDDLRGTAGVGAKHEHRTTTVADDGAKTVRTVGYTGDVSGELGKKTAAEARDGKVRLDLGRSDSSTTTQTVDGVSTTATRGNKSTLGGGYTSGKGASLDASHGWSSSTTTSSAAGTSTAKQSTSISGGASKDSRQIGVSDTRSVANTRKDADGTEHSDSWERTLSGGLSTKDGLTVGASGKIVNDRETQKLSDQLTLTTDRGTAEGSATAGVKRGEDGSYNATAAAKASATAFSQNVAYDNGKGLKGEAGYELGTASADAKASANITSDQIKVKGSAGAKVTLVGGHAKAEVPAFTWKLLGEPVRVKITAALNASVLAEANGEIELDVSKGDNLGVTVGGGGRAFAGAKAGVEVGAHIQWLRSDDYSGLLMDFLDDMPGFGWAVDDVPVDIWKSVATTLIGTGTSDLLIGKAGVFGSAGIGGEASFGLALQGGRIKMNGDLNGAIGLGGGAKTSLDLDAVDGIRFGGVIALRGVEWIKDHIGGAASWANQIIDEAQLRIDNYMEEQKAKGGIGGWFAGAVDWVGDDLFDLW